MRYSKVGDLFTFEFLYSIDYNKLVVYTHNLRDSYNKKMIKIKKLYEEHILKGEFDKAFYIADKHKSIVVDTIKHIISHLKKELSINKEYSIFLSNSFARGSNLFESDIDLNFIYDDKSLKDFEEIVCFCLSKVLGKERDFIHDSFSHRSSHYDYKNEDVLIIYNFNGTVVKEVVSSGHQKLMINHFFGDNSFNFYKEYIPYVFDKEFVLYQENLDSNKPFLYFYNYLLWYSKKNIDKDYFLDKIREYKKEIEEDIKELDNNLNIILMKDFKETFKNKAFNRLFKVISLNKQYDLFTKKGLNLENFHSYKKKSLNLFYKGMEDYIGEIMEFSYICYLENIPFRTRFSDLLDKKIDDIYKNLYDKNCLNFFNEELLKVYNLILEELSSLEKRL